MLIVRRSVGYDVLIAVRGKPIKEIARELRISLNTVRKIPRSGEASVSYEREVQLRPGLDQWKANLAVHEQPRRN